MKLTPAQWNALVVLEQGWAAVGPGTYNGGRGRRGVHRQPLEALVRHHLATRSTHGGGWDEGSAEITDAGRKVLAERGK